MKKIGAQLLGLLGPLVLQLLVSKAQGGIDKVVAKHG